MRLWLWKGDQPCVSLAMEWGGDNHAPLGAVYLEVVIGRSPVLLLILLLLLQLLLLVLLIVVVLLLVLLLLLLVVVLLFLVLDSASRGVVGVVHGETREGYLHGRGYARSTGFMPPLNFLVEMAVESYG